MRLRVTVLLTLVGGIFLLSLSGNPSCGATGTGSGDGGGGGGGGTVVGDNIGSCNEDIGSSGAISGASFNFITGTAVFDPASVARPEKCTTITDANFGTTIARITAEGEYSGAGIENEYARADPGNSDGTYLILRANSGEWHIYNASTFEMIFQLTGHIEEGGEELEPRWDAADPNTFYYLDGSMLRSYNVATRTAGTVHDFNDEFPSAAFITTKTEGDASLDRRYWCFMVENEDYSILSVIVYDRTSDTVVGQKSSFIDGINWVSMDMSGSHCVIGYEDSDADGDDVTPPAGVFSLNFGSSVSLPTGANGHMDLVLASDGRDVMVYQNNSTDFIEMADLETGAATQLIPIPFDVNGDIGLHVSGNSSATPGWALISTYGSRNPPSGQSHSWMDNQLFMVELKASPRIWRIAHNYSYTSDDYNPDNPVNYFAESFATINTEGTKIFFGSNWEIFTDLEYSDTYQVLLPEGWEDNIP